MSPRAVWRGWRTQIQSNVLYSSCNGWTAARALVSFSDGGPREATRASTALASTMSCEGQGEGRRGRGRGR